MVKCYSQISNALIAILLFVSVSSVSGNELSTYQIKGIVLNQETGAPITLAEVFISGSTYGTITDENAFGLKVDGNVVLHNEGNTLDAGNHTVSEVGLADYEPGNWGGDCNPDGSITLALDQVAICTITNNDTDSTSLTLVKKVVNNNSGNASPSAWALTASGPTGFNGKGPTVTSKSGFVAGTYNLSESGGKPGYVASDWVCVGGTQDDNDTITLALGESATCTITNTDENVSEVIFENGFESN